MDFFQSNVLYRLRLILHHHYIPFEEDPPVMNEQIHINSRFIPRVNDIRK